jgi:hypothetical protein
MSITGHERRAMLDRYDIVGEDDLLDEAQKMHEYRERATEAHLRNLAIQIY